MPEPSDVVYFDSPRALRAWFTRHAATATELWVGYHRKHTGRCGLTWPESVDEALCVGWIDGVRKRVDADRYTNRFTPRRPGSHWSDVNLARVAALTAEGRMTAAGLAVFAARNPARAGRASYEQRADAALDAALDRRFRSARTAWAFFQAQPPGYRRNCLFWVTSAKRAETRERRLAQLIADSAAGRRLGVATGTTSEIRRPAARGRAQPRTATMKR
jgi:uncharacterized protein YdeI (YjbR/CyaY-like superfamily)